MTEQTPTGLVAAKLAVMTEVKRLEKLFENKHGGYKFASVDDFKDHIRPIMARHGLTLHITEDGFDFIAVKNAKGGESNVAKIRFRFTLHHVSGETSEPSYFTVCLPYTGAQTSGAAQSYAIKEGVYKGLFQASSGDATEEADLHDQGQFSSADRLSKAEGRPVFEALQRELRSLAEETRDHVQVADWWSANKTQINVLPTDWYVTLKQEYADTYKTLKASEEMDRKATQ